MVDSAKKVRQSNFELLRIISMFLIVLGHVTFQTKFVYPRQAVLHNVSIQSLWIGGKLGVWEFTLISAYFLSRSRFKIESLKKVWGVTLFYSISIYAILVVTKIAPITPKLLVRSLMPVVSGQYWYVSAYIGMYVLVPYLNKMIEAMDKGSYRKFLTIILIMTEILPLIRNHSFMTGDTLFSLIPIYFIGGYLRKYSSDFDEKRIKYVIIFVIAILSMVASILTIDTVNRFLGTNIGWDYLLTQNSPLQMIAAVSLFLIARNTNIAYNRFINSVAASSFSVYLIHCHIAFKWPLYLNIKQYEHTELTVLYELLIAIGIYFFATVIDYLRIEMLSIAKLK